jgi:hypothetical protein
VRERLLRLKREIPKTVRHPDRPKKNTTLGALKFSLQFLEESRRKQRPIQLLEGLTGRKIHSLT